MTINGKRDLFGKADLRAAIQESNVGLDTNTILFNLGGSYVVKTLGKFTGVETLQELDLDGHLVQMVNSVNIHHKLIADLGYLQEHVFNLRRKYIDAADYQHIVTSPGYPGNFLPPSAQAAILHEPGDITGPVP